MICSRVVVSGLAAEGSVKVSQHGEFDLQVLRVKSWSHWSHHVVLQNAQNVSELSIQLDVGEGTGGRCQGPVTPSEEA